MGVFRQESCLTPSLLYLSGLGLPVPPRMQGCRWKDGKSKEGRIHGHLGPQSFPALGMLNAYSLSHNTPSDAGIQMRSSQTPQESQSWRRNVHTGRLVCVLSLRSSDLANKNMGCLVKCLHKQRTVFSIKMLRAVFSVLYFIWQPHLSSTAIGR